MKNNLRRPRILECGRLRSLNDEIIAKIGTPVFFVAPEMLRPNTEEPVGRFYEVVSGLYNVYHDYGVKFLDAYLSFCKKNKKSIGSCNNILGHIKSIELLRHMLCHGQMPDTLRSDEMTHVLEFYIDNRPCYNVSDFLYNMTAKDFKDILNKLCDESDELVSFLEYSSNEIEADPSLTKQWRQYLVQKVMTPDAYQYKNEDEREHFDIRIIRQIKQSVLLSGYKNTPHQARVQIWAQDRQSELLHGTMPPDSDYLYETLVSAIESLQKNQSFPEQNSAEMVGINFDALSHYPANHVDLNTAKTAQQLGMVEE